MFVLLSIIFQSNHLNGINIFRLRKKIMFDLGFRLRCSWTKLIMKKTLLLGLPDDLIEKGKDIKSVSEIEQNGDNFKVTITTGPKVIVNVFTIGQESEVETMTGEKLKARPLYFCTSVSLCIHLDPIRDYFMYYSWFKHLLLFIQLCIMCLLNIAWY